MKTLAIIQARTTSSRLPRKILMDLGGKPLIVNIVERASRAELIDKVVVATSVEASDDIVEEVLVSRGISCFRGNLNNVLERFFLCAKEYRADIVVRLTGDNALIDPDIINEAVKVFIEKKVDYMHYKNSLPLGMCIEVFTFNALKIAYSEAKNEECLEHVTPYICCNPNKFSIVEYIDDSKNHSDLRFTIDTMNDYNFVKKIYDSFEDNSFSYEDILRLLEKHKDWTLINNKEVQTILEYDGEK